MGWYREAVQLGRAVCVLRRSPGPPVLTWSLHQWNIGNGAEQQRVESQPGATCSLEASGTQVWDSEGSDMSNQAHRKRRSTRWVRLDQVQPSPIQGPYLDLCSKSGNLAVIICLAWYCTTRRDAREVFTCTAGRHVPGCRGTCHRRIGFYKCQLHWSCSSGNVG